MTRRDKVRFSHLIVMRLSVKYVVVTHVDTDHENTAVLTRVISATMGNSESDLSFRVKLSLRSLRSRKMTLDSDLSAEATVSGGASAFDGAEGQANTTAEAQINFHSNYRVCFCRLLLRFFRLLVLPRPLLR